ncbi:MAG TPA: hypothetical protein VKX49_24770 [Bryobacteraceae bacterium]|nr:hypothetical protein [Bryobacteraceae bacterium]
MRKWGLCPVLILAAAAVGCSESDQQHAREQADHTKQQASKDLHTAAGEARRGFDQANRAVTNALDSARQSAHDAVRDANHPRDRTTNDTGKSDRQ